MAEGIQHIAQQLKADIMADHGEASKALIEFAMAYAIENKLQHAALILKLNYSKAQKEAPNAKPRVKLEMQSLVDQIIEDFQANGATGSSLQAKEARRLLQEHYQNLSPPDDTVFSSEGLGKIYERSGFHLEDINLKLRLGEITGVVGENANGKTTLFRLVVGALKQDEGIVSYPFFQKENESLNWRLIKEQIAYVPQELPRWYGSLLQNIQYEASIHGIRGKDNEREVEFIIQRLDLEEHMDKRWKELSGGYKLRFSLAKALVWKPKLLVIDEPLANLDFKAQQVVLEDLRHLSQSLRYPLSVLISSQHLHEVEAISDKILFLKKGKVVFYDDKKLIGQLRQNNTYEIDGDFNLKDLKLVLGSIPSAKVSHNGIHYVIEAPLDLTYQDLMKKATEADLAVDYFRDISRSVKRLFEV